MAAPEAWLQAADVPVEDLRHVVTFVVSLAVGLLMGLERERKPQRRAGLRTFALLSLSGTACALVAEAADAPWFLAVGLLGVAATMIFAYAGPAPGEATARDPGTTTTVAAVLCFILGAMLWHGYVRVAVAIALCATALMYFKAELHGATRRLSRQDLVSFLQFAAVAAVILPLVPDQGLGPYGALNPYNIWLMVVLISGLSLAGYAVLRLVGADRGALLVGALGGLASSTATTLVFARSARARAALRPVALCAVLTANLVVLLRIGVMAAAVAPEVLPVLLPVLGAGLGVGSVAVLFAWRRMKGAATAPELALGNPAQLSTAFGFAVLFGVIGVASAWLHDLAGTRGVYIVAAVAGLTDMDAITLSTLQMGRAGTLPVAPVIHAIVLAYLSNLVFKTGMVWSIAGGALAARVAAGFALVALGLVVAAAMLS